MLARNGARCSLPGDARADARDQPRVVVEVAGAVDVVADLVAEDLPREVLEAPLGDLPQADHDGVVDEADHREGVLEPGGGFLLAGEAPGRVVQLGVAAPEREGPRPGEGPAVAQGLEVGGRSTEEAHGRHLSPRHEVHRVRGRNRHGQRDAVRSEGCRAGELLERGRQAAVTNRPRRRRPSTPPRPRATLVSGGGGVLAGGTPHRSSPRRGASTRRPPGRTGRPAAPRRAAAPGTARRSRGRRRTRPTRARRGSPHGPSRNSSSGPPGVGGRPVEQPPAAPRGPRRRAGAPTARAPVPAGAPAPAPAPRYCARPARHAATRPASRNAATSAQRGAGAEHRRRPLLGARALGRGQPVQRVDDGRR